MPPVGLHYMDVMSVQQMVLPTFPERKVGRRRHIPRLNEGSVRLRYDNNIEGKRNFYSQKISL